MLFNLFFVFFTDQTQQPRTQTHIKRTQTKKEKKKNTNRKFSSFTSQIQEANKPISSKPQIQKLKISKSPLSQTQKIKSKKADFIHQNPFPGY